MRYATGPDMAHSFMRRASAAADTARVIERLYEGRVTLHGDTLEPKPGLSVHGLGGHTFRQAVVRVETKRGAVVLASDVLHYYEEFERGVPFAVAQDIAAMLPAHAAVRRLADSDDHIIPAHDPLVLQPYPAARPELAGIVVSLDDPPRRG